MGPAYVRILCECSTLTVRWGVQVILTRLYWFRTVKPVLVQKDAHCFRDLNGSTMKSAVIASFPLFCTFRQANPTGVVVTLAEFKYDRLVNQTRFRTDIPMFFGLQCLTRIGVDFSVETKTPLASVVLKQSLRLLLDIFEGRC